MSIITNEWVSAGAGALISGALAVVLAQAAVIKKTGDPAELEQARQAVLQELAIDAGDELVPEEQSRLLLPANSSEPSQSNEVEDPALIVHTDHVVVATGKGALGTPSGRLSGAQERVVAARDSDKSVQSRKAVKDSPRQLDEQADQELQSRLHPRFRPDTTPVNAGFDGPELRSVGEDFAWDVHNVFQKSDGPMPFFYVDDDTKTLMFGLGWQH